MRSEVEYLLYRVNIQLQTPIAFTSLGGVARERVIPSSIPNLEVKPLIAYPAPFRTWKSSLSSPIILPATLVGM